MKIVNVRGSGNMNQIKHIAEEKEEDESDDIHIFEQCGKL
jgi:hypothetical protein